MTELAVDATAPRSPGNGADTGLDAATAAARLPRRRRPRPLVWMMTLACVLVVAFTAESLAPVLVQLMVWFNIGYIYPVISFGIPWGPTFFEEPSRNLVSALGAALIGLTLHESAFAAEIIRSGLLSVDSGQREAAHALALGPAHTFLKIILPQAMRSILPNAGSLLIGTLKSTTLISVIAVSDLLYAVQIIYNRTFEVVPLLLVACVWYLIVTSVLSALQFRLERHYGRGSSPERPTPRRLRHAGRALR